MKRWTAILPAFFIAFVSVPLWAAEAAEAAAHEEGPGMGIVYWGINFLILALGLIYFLRKPAKEFFTSRATLIRGSIDHARQQKDEAEKKFQEYENRLKSIEQEMQDLVANLKKDGELEKRRLIESAQQQSANLKSNSERILQQELRKAKEDLKKEAVNLATDLAEGLIRKNVTAEDQGRIVNQYLEKMEKLA